MKKLLIIILFLAGCVDPTDYTSVHKPSVLPSFKFKYGDIVQFDNEFYGKCVAKVTNSPYWNEPCSNKYPSKGGSYRYFFSKMFCGGEWVDNTGGIITRCEFDLELVKRGKRQ